MGHLNSEQQETVDELDGAPERPPPGSVTESYDDMAADVRRIIRPPQRRPEPATVEELIASGEWPIRRNNRLDEDRPA